MAALAEQVRQRLRGDRAAESQRSRSPPHPAARPVAVPGEIVLPARRDLGRVVRPAIRDHLRQPHHRALTSAGEEPAAPPGAEVSTTWKLGDRRRWEVADGLRIVGSAESEETVEVEGVVEVGAVAEIDGVAEPAEAKEASVAVMGCAGCRQAGDRGSGCWCLRPVISSVGAHNASTSRTSAARGTRSSRPRRTTGSPVLPLVSLHCSSFSRHSCPPLTWRPHHAADFFCGGFPAVGTSPIL